MTFFLYTCGQLYELTWGETYFKKKILSIDTYSLDSFSFHVNVSYDDTCIPFTR